MSHVPTTLKAFADLKPYSKGVEPDNDSEQWHQEFRKLISLGCAALDLPAPIPEDKKRFWMWAFRTEAYLKGRPR